MKKKILSLILASVMVLSLTACGGNNGGNDLTFENDPKQTLTIHKYIEGTQN